MLEYGGLFVTAFLAATILPLASEVPLALIVRAHGEIAIPVAVATAGNVLGACTTYWLAKATLPRLLERAAPRTQMAMRVIRRYGAPALLLSWIPLAGDALVVVAGASGMRVVPFLAWTTAGKAARYLVVAWLSV